MKNYFLTLSLGILIISGLSSCKKDDAPAKSKKEYLTSKAWVYDEYFTNYNTSSTMLAYKRGKQNNSMNLASNVVKFNTDGTYQETTETGAHLSGTWQFLSDETQTQVVNEVGTYTSNIILINDTKYEWYDQVSGRYGKMIPQP